MKADILRRAEAISDDEDEDDLGLPSTQNVPGEHKAATLVDEDDVDVDSEINRLKIVGDAGDDSDQEDGEEQGHSPETILELAYIRDPKLFDRDAQTRRSKTRADLKAQTGSVQSIILVSERLLMYSYCCRMD